MFNISNRKANGFTLVELLIVLSILALLIGITLTTFISFRKSQSLALDVQTITSVLRQARNQTLSSKNASVYGVHFSQGVVTLFTGATYTVGAATNEDFNLSGADTIVTISLAGGGSDVVFIRLTGETVQNGTIVVSSPSTSQAKTVTIYKTGLIDSQ